MLLLYLAKWNAHYIVALQRENGPRTRKRGMQIRTHVASDSKKSFDTMLTVFKIPTADLDTHWVTTRTPLVNCLLQLRRDPAWSTPFLVDVLCRPNQRCISGTLLRNSSVAIFSTHCNRSDINSVYLKAICYLALGPFSKSRSVNSEYLISRGKVAVVVRLRWGTVYQ